MVNIVIDRSYQYIYYTLCVIYTESEGKNSIRNTLVEDDSMHEGYSEVYDWRPSVEKTDVMRTMEAIEGKSYFFYLIIIIPIGIQVPRDIPVFPLLFRSPTEPIAERQITLAKVEFERTK